MRAPGAVTLLVIAAIIATLLRWIDHLSRLGRVTETTQRVEAAAAKALQARLANPYLGGSPLRSTDPIPGHAQPVYPKQVGYVQHVDIGSLSSVAEDGSGRVFLRMIPGAFVDPTTPLMLCEGIDLEDKASKLRECFTIGDVRSFDQDPRFGAIVLTEIASRALSPSINDPGTAIDVIGRTVRILSMWGEPTRATQKVEYPRIFVPPINTSDLFQDSFSPIARGGAAIVEVGVRLQKALRTLAQCDAAGFRESALHHSREAMELAEHALVSESDRSRLRELAAEIVATCGQVRHRS